MEREKFDRNQSRKNIESIGVKNNFMKKITLIAFKNLLTTSCMEIDGSVFYYKFKKNDDGASMLHLTRVEGGLYENIPPIQQYKVLADKIKELILLSNEDDNALLDSYNIPEDYRRVIRYVQKTYKK